EKKGGPMSFRTIAPAFVAAVALVATSSAYAQKPRKPAPKTHVKTAPKKAAPAAATPEPPPPPPPDLSIAAKYVSGDKTTASTVTLHGARQRVDYESALATIQQCDNARTLQLNTQTRTYLPASFKTDATVPPPGTKRKGGTITYTTTVTDTGERKTMFTMQARHLKTVIAKSASDDACDKTPEKVETDGWYIDTPQGLTCAAVPDVKTDIRVDAKDTSCSDVVTYDRPSATAGLPLAYTMTTTAGTDAPVVTTMEATDVKRIAADPATFDVPPDYVEVKTAAQLTADHRPGVDGPKKPGTIRIGVVPLASKAKDGSVDTKDLTEALVETLEDSEPDVVVLKSSAPADIDAEARQRQCDYILENMITDVRPAGHGMFARVAGTAGEGFVATSQYELRVPGQPKPIASGSERTGASLLQTGIGVAKRVSRYMPMFMMARYGYMNAFAQMSGSAAPGMMQQTQDPVLSGVFSLVDKATGAKPPQPTDTEQGAAAAALLRSVDAMSSVLKKRSGS
ncbi:MAG TPA: hypothetical protein VG871_04675, partial [Vicinamibacterales bacterium]|nr:hypothetical protein [Vicinamibacterales bacterium]